jgi:hypothetical protein
VGQVEWFSERNCRATIQGARRRHICASPREVRFTRLHEQILGQPGDPLRPFGKFSVLTLMRKSKGCSKSRFLGPRIQQACNVLQHIRCTLLRHCIRPTSSTNRVLSCCKGKLKGHRTLSISSRPRSCIICVCRLMSGWRRAESRPRTPRRTH